MLDPKVTLPLKVCHLDASRRHVMFNYHITVLCNNMSIDMTQHGIRNLYE